MGKIIKLICLTVSFTWIIFLLGCSRLTDNESRTRNINRGNIQFLTATVYNATVSSIENQELVEAEFIQPQANKHDFKYDQIKVIKGFIFKSILDFKFEPYFEQDYSNQEIEVVISLFALYSKEYDAWYEQKMIIFKTETEIVGFLSPQFGMIHNLNDFTVDLDNLYFESPMILTDEAVVKYYERGDRLYSFDVKLTNPNQMSLDISTCLAFESEYVKVNTRVTQNSLFEVGSSEILEIMDLAKIEKVYVNAKVSRIDFENSLIEVTSADVPSLETVTFTTNIYDKEGKLIPITKLEVGDIIQVYYYKRFNHYQPVNIRVEQLTVDKAINIEEQQE